MIKHFVDKLKFYLWSRFGLKANNIPGRIMCSKKYVEEKLNVNWTIEELDER